MYEVCILTISARWLYIIQDYINIVNQLNLEFKQTSIRQLSYVSDHHVTIAKHGLPSYDAWFCTLDYMALLIF